VSELFNSLERTVEHKVNGIIIYVYNEDESALTTFFENTGRVVMEKCNIACLVSLKCEESNNYNSNCLLFQRRWLLCTSYGEYKAARTCEDFKSGASARIIFLFLSENSYVKKEYSFTKYNTLLHV
jgi:hypothetical protein